MDNALMAIVSISAVFVVSILIFLILGIVELFRGKRKFNGFRIGRSIGLVLSLLFIWGIEYCLYHVPNVVMGGITWDYLVEAGPGSIVNAAVALGVAVPMICIFFLFIAFFKKRDKLHKTI